MQAFALSMGCRHQQPPTAGPVDNTDRGSKRTRHARHSLELGSHESDVILLTQEVKTTTSRSMRQMLTRRVWLR